MAIIYALILAPVATLTVVMGIEVVRNIMGPR